MLADAHGLRSEVDRQVLATRDARLPHAPGDDGGVGRHTAVRGQHAARVDEPVDVVRRRLPADEDDVVARLAALLGRVGVEHDRPGGGAGRGVEPLGRDLDLRVRVDHRVQELVELGGVDANDRFLAGDEPLVDHLGRDAERGSRRPLPRAGLQEVERPLLDRELDVLQVAVVGLEAVERVDELLERRRHELLHPLHRLGRADAGDDVLALCVQQELAVQLPLPGGGVPSEADARSGRVSAIPEHHLDDVHGRSEVFGDVVRPAVDLRPRRVPGVEDGAVGALQLVARLLRERSPGLLLVDRFEGRNQLTKIVGGQLDVVRDAPRGLEVRERLLEALSVDAVDDLAEHLDETSVRVEREARVARRLRQSLDGDVVQAEVENRVHHPGHRDRGARPHRDEQRLRVVAESLPAALLERSDVLVHFRVEPFRDVSAACEVGATRLRRDGEAVGHGDAELRHLGEADPFPAEELTTAARVLAEIEDVAHLRQESTCTGRGPDPAWLRGRPCRGCRQMLWRWCLGGASESSPTLKTVLARFATFARGVAVAQELGQHLCVVVGDRDAGEHGHAGEVIGPLPRGGARRRSRTREPPADRGGESWRGADGTSR